MGEIYEATHARLAGRYAIKLLRPEIAATSEAFARFQREAKVTSALQHPNIVQVVDFSAVEGGASYLVMEFLDGPELSQLMKSSGALPLPRVVSYVKQIASGLMAAHQHDVVHRDLKPQNIFVLEVVGHERELVKIVDFGISKVNDVTTTITSTSTVIGTAHYMSPEQARGRVDEIDARSDQFSLAVIVYEMLTGQDAFRGDSISSLVYQIVHEEPPALVAKDGPLPPAVASVLRRALSKDKERRFPTVMAFASALEEAATAGAEAMAKTITAKATVADAARPWRRVAAGAALLGVAAIVVLTTRRSEAPPSAQASALAAPATAVAPPPTPTPSPPREVPPPAVAQEPPAIRAPEPAAKRVSAMSEHKRTAAATRHAAAAPAADCNPNYTVDAQGDKHFKPECFLDQKGAP